MRTGRRLAIDVGKVRIGLAISDVQGILASGLATVNRQENLRDTVKLLLQAVDDFELLEIYVGLPLALGGGQTASTQDALDLAAELASQVGIEVKLIDERLTTVSATSNLRQAGISSKNQRKIIDQEAAALILENALNQERLQGTPPGRSISEF